MRAPAENPGASTVPCKESFPFLQEGDYVLKTLTDPEERVQAYRLRHRVFCEKLNWVSKKKRDWRSMRTTIRPFPSACSTGVTGSSPSSA